MDFPQANESRSAHKDFYVESSCCTLCGVPRAVAPDLIGENTEGYGSCFWKKQPVTEAEFEQAFAIFGNQELGCHRYAGSNAEVQARIGRENCDHPLSLLSIQLSALLPDEDSRLRLLSPEQPNLLGRLWAAIRRRKE